MRPPWWSTARAHTSALSTGRWRRRPVPRQICPPATSIHDALACGGDLIPGLVQESAPFDPRNTYAATKVHGEHLADSWARETGASVAALRFHNVYGPGLPVNTPYAGVAALFRSRLAHGDPPLVYEDGRQRRNFIHVEDVARLWWQPRPSTFHQAGLP